MSRYRIVCTEQEPATNHPKNAHIVAVGVGNDPNQANGRFTLSQVLQKMDNGDTFFTKGLQTGKVAELVDYKCAYCGKRHIRSASDATTDNNLDDLRICRSFN